MPALRRVLFALGVLAALSFAALADERGDAAKKQKEAAEEKVKASELKFAAADTADLMVYAPYSEGKVQTLAATLQKTYAAAGKALGVKTDEPVFTGKLTVFVLPDAKQYRQFVLKVNRMVPDRKETFRFDLSGDTPTVLAGFEPTGKPTDTQVAADAAAVVGAAVLRQKIGGTAPPEWLLLGFGRAAYVRSDGPTSARMNAHKQRVRALLTKSRGQAFKCSVATSGQGGPDVDLVATSLAEYLAFGPQADKFTAFVGALKPDENGNSPSFEAALQSLEWTPNAFEMNWQKWVATGK